MVDKNNNTKLCNFNIENSSIISMALIGSFNTEYWIENRSDIDIVILLDKKIDVSLEFDIEDEVLPMLKQYFNHHNIHITFLYMNDFEEELAREYIKSTDKLILDHNKEIDFRLYVNKYIRNNQWLEDLIKRDMKNRNEGVHGTIL